MFTILWSPAPFPNKKNTSYENLNDAKSWSKSLPIFMKFWLFFSRGFSIQSTCNYVFLIHNYNSLGLNIEVLVFGFL